MRAPVAYLCLSIATCCCGQKPQPALPEILGFEAAPNGKLPGGWNGSPLGTISVDSEVVHSGKYALKLERVIDSPEKFTGVNLDLPVDFAGKKVELRGFLKTDSVSNFTGLWLREDGPGTTLLLDNMHDRKLQGTTDWTEYSITLPLHPEAERIEFGVLAYGTGRVWADDLQLLIDGKPVWTVPKIENPKTILDSDHEFDAGSNISLTELSKAQIENLALMGKVWGFVKYHDPRVAAVQKHWDYELLRVLPAILSAKDQKSAQSVTVDWLDRLGAVAPCSRCASLVNGDLHLRPDLVWLSNRALLGEALADRLQLIYRNRGAGVKHFYVSKRYGAQFDHELDYAKVRLPDPGFQILAVFRFWNIIEYWFPYRDVLGENWDQVLKEHLPRIALARDGSAYWRELIALIARAHDTHANLWSSLQDRPPIGECLVPVNIHFVEGRAVVTSIPRGHNGLAPPLQVGDEITTIDDVSVSDLMREWKPYFADSNEAAMRRDMGVVLTRGSCREGLRIGVRREGHEAAVNVGRISYRDFPLEGTHDLPGQRSACYRMTSPT